MIKQTFSMMTVAAALFAGAPAIAQDRHNSRRGDHRTSSQRSGGSYKNVQKRVHVPGHYVYETRTQRVAGYHKTVYKDVQVPGRYETRRERVWVPGHWERRGHRTRARVDLGPVNLRVRGGSNKVWVPGRHEVVTKRVYVPGCTERRAVKVWVPACTRPVKVKVWKKACYEVRTVRVWVPSGPRFETYTAPREDRRARRSDRRSYRRDRSHRRGASVEFRFGR